jgi:DNA modification methylase
MLTTLASETVQTCVTSPPYWGLRDYGVDGQIGLESTPQEYVDKMVQVFREVRRVLKDDATLWLNLGDSYCAHPPGICKDTFATSGMAGNRTAEIARKSCQSRPPRTFDGLKPKDLVGIPWRVAFTLQADGWYLRSDIIWAKPNPMPESVTDRPTKAHEYIFLLSKSERYFYDAEAIKEPFADERLGNPGTYRRLSASERKACNDRQDLGCIAKGGGWNADGAVTARNKRTVWEVPTQPYPEAHFATFPPKLIEPCILAGSRPGDTVLDPFAGSGTTLYVAKELNRQFIGIELNPAYIELANKRLAQEVLPL